MRKNLFASAFFFFFVFTLWVVNKVVIIYNVVPFVTLGSKCFFNTYLARVWYALGRTQCKIRISDNKSLLFKMWKKDTQLNDEFSRSSLL